MKEKKTEEEKVNISQKKAKFIFKQQSVKLKVKTACETHLIHLLRIKADLSYKLFKNDPFRDINFKHLI